MTIGDRIKKARELRGMDYQGLALKASLNAWAIVAFENGTAVILVPTLIRLCDALNVSADWLLGRTKSPFPWSHRAEALMEKINQLNPEGCRMLEKIVDALAEKGNDDETIHN